MDKKEFVCIACPNSCKLTVWEEAGEIHVEGHTCKRGIDHGKNEYTNPMRMLTTTVAIEGGHHRRLSVSSTGEIPKAMMSKQMAAYRETRTKIMQPSLYIFLGKTTPGSLPHY